MYFLQLKLITNRKNKNNFYMYLYMSMGFPGKESSCTVGDLGSIPGLGRSSEEGKGYPLQCSGLENYIQSMGSQRVGHD